MAGNKLTKVDGVAHLESLQVLDVSNNQIEDLPVDVLPSTIPPHPTLHVFCTCAALFPTLFASPLCLVFNLSKAPVRFPCAA